MNQSGSIAPVAAPSVVDADPYRILADQDGVGDEPSIVVIEDAAEFDSWWDELGFPGRPPAFRPDSELIVGFTATYPSGCQYGFSDLRIRAEQRSVEARYYGSEPSDSCAADENPFTVVVAIDRAVLGAGTWEARMSVGGQVATFDVG